MLGLKKKNVILAGAGGLIGKTIHCDLLQHGCNVHPVDSNPTVDTAIYCDINNRDELQKILDSIPQLYGFVNATYPKNWIDHIKGYINASEQVFSHLTDKYTNNACIVNLASIYGVVGPDDRLYATTKMNMPTTYAAAKGAIIAHSKCLSSKGGEFNIRVNTISPGGIFDNQPESFIKKYNSKVPLGRMAITADISGVVCFLLSKQAQYITGQNIVVDGGATSRL